MTSSDAAEGHRLLGAGQRSRLIPHLLGIGWVVAAGFAVLIPALHHGLSLGPYDVLSRSGLTRQPGVVVHNSVSGDQIDQIIPWSTLAWTQVHHWQLPLWNPYSGLGLPLAFNWQSSAFSLPTIIGYLFPLRLAYTAQLLVTLMVAGTGAYALGRVLRLGVVGCAAAGTIYELSGAMMGWLGWPHASVMSWSGWLFAAVILVIRGRHRVRNIAFVAVVLALAVYSGQPEIVTILMLSIGVFVVSLLLLRFVLEKDSQPLLRPVVDLAIAAAAGAGLSAPLALPGLQLVAGSTRNSGTLVDQTEVGKALPVHDLAHLIVQGYNGLPLAGSHVFGDGIYVDTAAYVGVIGFVLAVLGATLRRRRPEVSAFTVVAIFTVGVVFVPFFQVAFSHLPFVQTIDWHRDLMCVALAFAILAGVGMDVLVRMYDQRAVQRLAAAGFAACGVILFLLWVFGSGHLSSAEATIRAHSLIWPAVAAAFGLALIILLSFLTRHKGRLHSIRRVRGVGKLSSTPSTRNGAQGPPPARRGSTGQWIGACLLAFETVLLVGAGAPLWTSTARSLTPNPAVAQLRATTGQATIGFGSFTCFAGPGLSGLGILPNANIFYEIHEFDVYDPILPTSYYRSWLAASGTSGGVRIYNEFCPRVTTAALARQFGVSFVLMPSGAAGPQGSVFVETVGDERLYRIPGAGAATLTPVPTALATSSANSLETPVRVTHSSPSAWTVVTTGSSPKVLRLHLTNVPGWHATIDGRPLALKPLSGLMFQARVPPGSHRVELDYWPSAFTAGLILAACSASGLLIALVVVGVRTRRRSGHASVADS